MDSLDVLAFAALFKEAYANCFGLSIKNPLSETESKIFCNKILEQTGLSIGWKSMKNYSFFIMDAAAGKRENPSTATLDTLARYVLGAPYSNEISRKNEESHYPYWFLYREKFVASSKINKPKKVFKRGAITIAILIPFAVLLVYFELVERHATLQFTDDFSQVDDASLLRNGWFVKSIDPGYWNKRNETPGQLTLFTLKGDNWPDPAARPEIKNLLLREIATDCFTAEVHLKGFIPSQEWQQAGFLLLEDTSFAGKSMRLSLAYNDYFGGVKKPREILLQAITSLGNGFGKPEEVAHKPIFYPDSASNNGVLVNNLKNSALRIEKRGNNYRFLYAGGTRENGAFKEVATLRFDMQPRFIGIFAIKGFTNAADIPVSFKFFRISGDTCN